MVTCRKRVPTEGFVMEFFFHPKSIVIVGATPNKSKGGYAILKNLQNTFQGPIYPVNPRYKSIGNLVCYPSVYDVPGKPDLAILFIPASQTPDAAKACVAKGIPGVIIESGGFSEIGGDGEISQTRLSMLAGQTDTRIWGPNCMGLVDGKNGFVFSFTDPLSLSGLLEPGPVSLVVQSGMLSAGFIVDLLSHKISGFNKVCSIGNRVDINECDLLEYLLQDNDTRVIGFYLESFVNLKRFIEIYRLHRRAKPVVILKGGKSETGRQAAMSHTASMAGSHHILADVLGQAGILEARDFHQMVDLCRTLGMVLPRPHKSEQPGIAILTFSGASGIVAADFLDGFGIKVAELDRATTAKLSTIFPAWMPPANPVDLWPAMEQHSGQGLDIYSLALDAVLADTGVDACMVHTFAGFSRVRLNLSNTAELSRKWGKPVFIWVLGERDEILNFQVEARKLGIPVYHELYRATECMVTALKLEDTSTRWMDMEAEDSSNFAWTEEIILPEDGTILDEHVSKKILMKAGLPTVEEHPALSVAACLEATAHMGYPVVLKGLQPGCIHKTEAGLVRADLHDKPQLIAAFHELKNRMPPGSAVLIQRQIKGTLELIMGYMRDPQHGPCVMVGLGGIFAETVKDTAFALAPLTVQKAASLIGSLKYGHLLNGFRGYPPAPIEVLARYLVILGRLGNAFPSIREIDINPLILSESGPVIVDATIIQDRP